MENKKLCDLVRKQTEAIERLGRRIGAMESTMQELSNDITAAYLDQHRVGSNDRPIVVLRKSKYVAPGHRIIAKRRSV